MKNATPQIILPAHAKTLPNPRELSTAKVIAAYFQADIYIIPTSNRKTADFKINGIMWELKTPTGNGKYNIQHLLHAATQQSKYIIVDSRFSKMNVNKMKSELKFHSRFTTKGIKRLLLIQKDQQIVEII